MQVDRLGSKRHGTQWHGRWHHFRLISVGGGGRLLEQREKRRLADDRIGAPAARHMLRRSARRRIVRAGARVAGVRAAKAVARRL